MDEIRKLQLKVYKFTILLACVVSALSVFIIEDYKGFVLGLAFGTLIALLNFSLLAQTMRKAANMPPERAKNYASMQYFLRYIVYGLVIFISIKAPYLNVLGTIAGIISIKVVVYITHLFNDKTYYTNIFKKKNR